MEDFKERFKGIIVTTPVPTGPVAPVYTPVYSKPPVEKSQDTIVPIEKAVPTAPKDDFKEKPKKAFSLAPGSAGPKKVIAPNTRPDSEPIKEETDKVI